MENLTTTNTVPKSKNKVEKPTHHPHASSKLSTYNEMMVIQHSCIIQVGSTFILMKKKLKINVINTYC